MLRRTLTTLVLLAALVPPGAAAVWKIDGRGYGHGVGMSQWGAYGFAERGSTYREILAHYYTGTRVETLPRRAGGPELEAQVRALVSNEVSSSWPKHAIRAQAVASRSYTAAGGTKVAGDGVSARAVAGPIAAAVRATKREVVTYRGKVATTFYFSSSGGRTEASQFGFPGGQSLPYLKSVSDPYDDASPEHRWRETFTDKQMSSGLRGLFAGRLERIEVLERGSSPRIVRLRVIGSAGSTAITGDTLRNRLGLRSTWAKLTRSGAGAAPGGVGPE